MFYFKEQTSCKASSTLRTPEQFKTGGFTLKTHQMFFVNYAGGIAKRTKSKNRTQITGTRRSSEYTSMF